MDAVLRGRGDRRLGAVPQGVGAHRHLGALPWGLGGGPVGASDLIHCAPCAPATD